MPPRALGTSPYLSKPTLQLQHGHDSVYIPAVTCKRPIPRNVPDKQGAHTHTHTRARMSWHTNRTRTHTWQSDLAHVEQIIV